MNTMTTQEDYEDDPIRSLPIHEVEDYHFLERNVSLSSQPAGEWRDNKSFMDLPIHEVEQPHFLERNVSLSDQPAGEWRDTKSFMDLPIHEVEQPHFLESDVSVFGQPAGEWRDNKSAVEATYESEIHTKSSEDISEDISDDEEESKGEGVSEDGDIDALIASELNKMTLKEREEAMFDVHGVSEDIEEVPDMVARKFDELESILAKKRSKKRQRRTILPCPCRPTMFTIVNFS
jgi:hypothetical protein